MLVSIPVLIWFAAAGGLPDLFGVYFFDNLFRYPKTTDIYGNSVLGQNLINGLLNYFVFNTTVFIAAGAGLIRLGREKQRQTFIFVSIIYFSLYFFIYISFMFN